MKKKLASSPFPHNENSEHQEKCYHLSAVSEQANSIEGV